VTGEPGGGEVLADRAELGAAVVTVFQEPGGLHLVGIVVRACVSAEVGLEVRVDRSGLDEADQAVGEVRCLGPGGKPDGQPPAGDGQRWCRGVTGFPVSPRPRLAEFTVPD
jgi:hypothetical protein